MSKLTKVLLTISSFFIALVVFCVVGFVVIMITPPFGRIHDHKEVRKVPYEEVHGVVEGFVLIYKNIKTGEIGFGDVFLDSRSAVQNLRRIKEKGAHRKGHNFTYKLLPIPQMATLYKSPFFYSNLIWI